MKRLYHSALYTLAFVLGIVVWPLFVAQEKGLIQPFLYKDEMPQNHPLREHLPERDRDE